MRPFETLRALVAASAMLITIPVATAAEDQSAEQPPEPKFSFASCEFAAESDADDLALEHATKLHIVSTFETLFSATLGEVVDVELAYIVEDEDAEVGSFLYIVSGLTLTKDREAGEWIVGGSIEGQNAHAVLDADKEIQDVTVTIGEDSASLRCRIQN